jgi:hypothetical protein
MTRIRKPASTKPTTRRRGHKLEFLRLKGALTGKALTAAMQVSPCRDVDIEPGRMPMPVRNVSLWKHS